MPKLRIAGGQLFLAFLLAVSLPVGWTPRAVAQPGLDSALPVPKLLTVFPMGGKSGTVTELTFTGQDLEEPELLLFSHPGIKAEPILPPPPPLDPKKPPMPPVKPVITRFKVTIAAEVPLGIHDVRLVNKWGASNARAFVVGDLTEVLEKEPNNDVEQAQRVELNTTINGNLSSATDVDYCVFAGKKGQRVVVSCLASSIDSRFHPGLEVYDSKGKQLAFSRDYFHHDALTDVTLPEDGDYYVRLYQFTHIQGTAEHFYRLSVTTAPWIDAIHPPMVEPGKSAQVTVYGRNLPGGQLDPAAVVDGKVLEKLTVTVAAPADPMARQRLAYTGFIAPPSAYLDGFEYRIRNASGVSNPFLLTYATAPVVLDNETPRTPATAQEITLPCEIAGRIEKRRHRDWYVFTAKKGETYTIEVLSERLGAPTSMYFVLRNAATNQDIFESPDNPTFVSQKFYGRTDDPQEYRFTVPADGKYLLLVHSRVGDTLAGPRHYYRVRLTPAQPDFRLVVMSYANTRPDSAIVSQGGEQAFTVLVQRRDGFAGDIVLSAEGLPASVTCVPQVVGGGVTSTNLVVSAAATAPLTVGEIKIKGTATINGQPALREARTGSIVWPMVQPQQPSPTLSRLDRSVPLAVREKAPYRLVASLDKPVLLHGDKGSLKAVLTRSWPDFKNPLTVQMLATEVPAGLLVNNNQPLTIAAAATEGVLPIQVNANVLPGTYNLVLRAFAPVPFNKDPKAAQKPPVNVVQVSTPVSLTIAPKSVATLTLSTAQPTVKVGAQTEIVIKVARLYSFTGELKVEVVLPANMKGVVVAPVVIPAGQDEVKLLVKAPADALPGNRAGLIVRTTALYNGTVPTTQETALSVNVVK